MGDLSSEEEFDSGGQQHLGNKLIKKAKRGEKKTHKMISSTYQTKKCQFFNRGSCHKGVQCTYSHTFTPDVAKKICKFYLSNSCSKGATCPYSHNTKRYPCKFFHIQKSCLQGQECRFSHEPIHQEFQDEFLKDNEDFLIKLVKQEWKLPDRYADYVVKNDLMSQDKKDGNDQHKLSKPFIFGITSSLESKREQVLNKSENERVAKTEIRDPRLKQVEKAIEKSDPRLKDKKVLKNKEEGPKETIQLQQFLKKKEKQQFYLHFERYLRSFY